LSDDIFLTGRISNEQLALLMASAFALTFVPFYEGFGIPLVEAMASEVPIITSNVSSLPEISGEAALFVDPNNVNDIKKAMLRMYSDEALRKNLITKGIERRQQFSWDKSAELLWNSILKTINQNE
jgi:glycosyltransferase involved in cell wall biosynthesis